MTTTGAASSGQVPRNTVRAAGIISTALAAGVLLAGCGLSSLTSGIGGGLLGGSSPSPGSTQTGVGSITEESMLSAAKADNGTVAISGEIAHGCPRFLVWQRDNQLTIYEPGRAGDSLAVMHRGEITKTARECAVDPGRVTVKYGFSGRVLLGPKGRTGRVALPLNVFVTDAKRSRIVNEKLMVDVEVSLDNPIGYFSLVRTVSFPIPEGTRPGEFELFVGFERTAPGAG